MKRGSQRSAVVMVLGWFSAAAMGQATDPAVFAANNGNLRGSVSSYRIDRQTGALTFVQEYVIGSTPSTGQPVPGTNADAISLTPSGRFLAVSHTTAASISEQVTILRVRPDATVEGFAVFQTPDSPLDLQWIDDAHLAVTRTRSTGQNQVIVYRFDEAARTLTEIDRENCTAFTASIAVTLDRRFLYAPGSPLGGLATIDIFSIGADRTLERVGNASTGAYALGPGITPDGRFMYVCGGTGGGNQTFGFSIQDGLLTPVPGFTFQTGGSSPKQAAASPDGRFVYVGHGSDGTVRAMAVDEQTGALSPAPAGAPWLYDVGIQGSLGEVITLRVGALQLIVFSDAVSFDGTGYGVFSGVINGDGSVRIVSTRIDSRGIGTYELAGWAGAGTCAADLDDGSGTGVSDGAVTLDDLLYFLAVYEAGAIAGDLDDGSGNGTRDGAVTIDDLLYFVARYELGC